MVREIPDDVRVAVLALRRKKVVERDYHRELRRLTEHGHTHEEISRWLALRPSDKLSAFSAAATVTMPLDGFSDATPYEICERYSVGFIDRAQLIDELTRYPYVKGGETDGYDSLIIDPPGTWSEVSDARHRGLIGRDVYSEVFNRRHSVDTAQGS
ncbi:MAG: hypothetical protein ACRCSP_06925 [Rhodoglobus sp.]